MWRRHVLPYVQALKFFIANLFRFLASFLRVPQEETVAELQLRYVQLLQTLPTHGAAVFNVTERVAGKPRATPRILAVGVRRIVLLDAKTHEVRVRC